MPRPFQICIRKSDSACISYIKEHSFVLAREM